MTEPSRKDDYDEALDEFYAAIGPANDGDGQALSHVRALVRGEFSRQIVDLAGNMADHVEKELVDRLAGDQPGTREMMLTKLQMMREELAGPTPSPLEVLLVERVVATWLQVCQAEWIAATANNVSFTQARHNELRMDRSLRRHLAAIKMLATIRKMELPIRVDLNLTANVAGKTNPSAPMALESDSVPTAWRSTRPGPPGSRRL